MKTIATDRARLERNSSDVTSSYGVVESSNTVTNHNTESRGGVNTGFSDFYNRDGVVSKTHNISLRTHTLRVLEVLGELNSGVIELSNQLPEYSLKDQVTNNKYLTHGGAVFNQVVIRISEDGELEVDLTGQSKTQASSTSGLLGEITDYVVPEQWQGVTVTRDDVVVGHLRQAEITITRELQSISPVNSESRFPSFLVATGLNIDYNLTYYTDTDDGISDVTEGGETRNDFDLGLTLSNGDSLVLKARNSEATYDNVNDDEVRVVNVNGTAYDVDSITLGGS